MYIAKVPNRGSAPAILLRESYREDGKVKNRTLANLSRWPQAKVDALSAVLKGNLPKGSFQESFSITRSLPHGHVAAVLGTLRSLGLEELIDPHPSRNRNLITAMIVAQVIDPSSKLAYTRGLRTDTASSSLGEVLSLTNADSNDLYAELTLEITGYTISDQVTHQISVLFFCLPGPRVVGIGAPMSSNALRCVGVGRESFSIFTPLAKMTLLRVRVERW